MLWVLIRSTSLFFHENIRCGYSLEVPHGGASNEYPQHNFSWRNKKNINSFRLKNVSYLEIWSIILTICILSVSFQSLRIFKPVLVILVMFKSIIKEFSRKHFFLVPIDSQFPVATMLFCSLINPCPAEPGYIMPLQTV